MNKQEIIKVVKDCRHVLDTYQGLIATDKPESGITWELDDAALLKKLDVAIAQMEAE